MTFSLPRRIWRSVVPQRVRAHLAARRTQRLALRRLSRDFGLLRSLTEEAGVDANGTPLPWYTYPAIEQIDLYDVSDCTVFEFGAGNSTLFWADRARRVISVEHDREWVEAVGKRSAGRGNIEILYRPDPQAYLKALPETGVRPDIVAVDGIERFEAVRVAAEFVAETGVVILDNSDDYMRCARILRDAGMFQIDYNGFGPMNPVPWRTSFFIRPGFALRRRGDDRRMFSEAYATVIV